MSTILPSEIQRWVTAATESGLSAASVRKYQHGESLESIGGSGEPLGRSPRSAS